MSDLLGNSSPPVSETDLCGHETGVQCRDGVGTEVGPELGHFLGRIGHDSARNTIKAILKDHGIEPAPERGTTTPWKTFLERQSPDTPVASK